MPIINSFNDITKYEGDAIVNSIGVEGKLYGRLCKTILKEANDKELEIFINSQYNQIGTVLVTKAGKLPCKNIIHVVTPFKKDDDGNNSNLIKAYESIISKALEIGIKSIAIPFIGTGANGYDENDAYESIMAACSQILIQEEKEDRDILDITVVAYLKKQQSYQKVREEQETRMIYDSTVNNKTKENEFSRVF